MPATPFEKSPSPADCPVYAELRPLDRHAAFVDHLFVLRDRGRLAASGQNLFASPFSEIALVGRVRPDGEAMQSGGLRWTAIHLAPRFGRRNRNAGLHGWLIGVRCGPINPAPSEQTLKRLVDAFAATFDREGPLDADALALDGWIDRVQPILDPAGGGSAIGPPLLRAVPAMADRPGRRVRDVATTLGVAPRTLQRHVRERTGLAPKRFASVQRFSATLAAVARGDDTLAGIAARAGYNDQAHLSADLTRHAGISPGRFRAQARQRIVGTPVRFFQDGDIRNRLRLLVIDTDE